MCSISEMRQSLRELRQEIAKLREKIAKAMAAAPIWTYVHMMAKKEECRKVFGIDSVWEDILIFPSMHLKKSLEQSKRSVALANKFRDGDIDPENEEDDLHPIENLLVSIEVCLATDDEAVARKHCEEALYSSRWEHRNLESALKMARVPMELALPVRVKQRVHLLALLDKQ